MANYLGQPLNLQTARTQARNPINQTVNTGNTVGNTINSLLQGAKGAEFLANRGTRDTLNEQQIDSNKQSLDANAQKLAVAKDKQLRTSLATGAQEFLNAYKSGGPDAGYASLVQRKQKLAAEGKSTAETDAAIAAFQQNPEQFAKQSQGAIENAYEQGILKQPKIGGNTSTANIKDFAAWTNMPPGPEKDAFARKAGFAETQKTVSMPTPTGTVIIDKNSGEVLNRVVDPDKKAKFDEEQKVRHATLKEKQRKTEQSIKETKLKEQDAAASRKAAIGTTQRALSIVKELSKVGVIEPVTGSVDARTWTFFNSSQDIINKGLELKDLLTLDNLGLMKGVLTDRDIAILARAGSGLNMDEKGFLGSEDGVREQINRVAKILKSKLEAAVERGDLSKEDYETMIADEVPTMGYGNSAAPVQRDSYIRKPDTAPVRRDGYIGQPTPNNNAPKIGRFTVEEE